jgi:hypothetical protein
MRRQILGSCGRRQEKVQKLETKSDGGSPNISNRRFQVLRRAVKRCLKPISVKPNGLNGSAADVAPPSGNLKRKLIY